MSSAKVTIIAALARNRVIGVDNRLPWRLPRDLGFFMRTTMGHSLVMGRRTFESLKAPLQGRTLIVVTRRLRPLAEGVLQASTMDEALGLVPEGQTPFVAGGAEIYRLALPRTEKMLLTLVHADVAGDTFFPEFDLAQWQLIRRRDWPPDDRHLFATSFLEYVRRIVRASGAR